MAYERLEKVEKNTQEARLLKDGMSMSPVDNQRALDMLADPKYSKYSDKIDPKTKAEYAHSPVSEREGSEGRC